MNENIEFLNYIYQNVEAVIKSLENIIKIMEDKEMRSLLKKQLKSFEMILKETERKIKEYGKTPKGIGKLEKIKSYLIIKINTLWSVTKHYVSGMLIKGITSDIEEISNKIEEYNGADKKVIDIATKLIKVEKDCLDELKTI